MRQPLPQGDVALVDLDVATLAQVLEDAAHPLARGAHPVGDVLPGEGIVNHPHLTLAVLPVAAFANTQAPPEQPFLEALTGKLVNVTQYDGSPGKNCTPQGAITDCQGLVVSQNSPSSICHFINGVWICF